MTEITSVNPANATSTSMFLAIREITSKLEYKTVKDKHCRSSNIAILGRMVDCYILESLHPDKAKTTKDVYISLKKLCLP
jgi:hypothetical protein